MMMRPVLCSLWIVCTIISIHINDCFGFAGLSLPSLTGGSSLSWRSTQDLSTNLLNRCIQHLENKGLQDCNDEEIESIITEIINRQEKVRPVDCLNGPVFACAYQTILSSSDNDNDDDSTAAKTPQWVKWSTIFPSTRSSDAAADFGNIQGQQYEIQPNGLNGRVANYGELWGRNLYMQVYGDVLPTRESEKKKQQQSFNLFGGSTVEANCPIDYKVVSTGAELRIKIPFLLQPFVSNDEIWKVPLDFIRGTGLLRILYGDERLRIFISPQGNDPYESAGLVTVQIRSDLLDLSNNEDSTSARGSSTGIDCLNS